MTTGDRVYDANASVIEAQVINLQNGTPTAAQTAVAALAAVSVGAGGDYPTWAAYLSAIGDAPVLGAQTVTLLGDLAASDQVRFPRVGSTGSWTLAGATAVIHAGTLTGGTTPYVPGPPAASAVAEDTALPVSWAASGLEGKLIENTTQGDYSYVLLSLAAKQARIGRGAASWANGDAYQVLSRPAVGLLAPGSIDCAPGGTITVQDVLISGGNIDPSDYGGSGFGSPVHFQRCDLGVLTGVYKATLACTWTAPDIGRRSDVYGSACYLVADGSGGVVQISSGSFSLVGGQAQGTSVVQNDGLVLLDLVSFDHLAGYPAYWMVGGESLVFGLAGSGGTAEGVIVGNGKSLIYAVTPSATGAAGELTLGVTAYTWAALAASPVGLTDVNFARAIPA